MEIAIKVVIIPKDKEITQIRNFILEGRVIMILSMRI